MAEIILGIGTSHSPLLTFDANDWLGRAEDDRQNQELTLSDGRTLTFEELSAERGGSFAEQSSREQLEICAAKTGPALDLLEQAIRDAKPDVVLVIGDDQEELYKAGNTPALAIYYGEELIMRPLGKIVRSPPEWMQNAISGYAMDSSHRFPAAPDLARKLIDKLMDTGVDLGVASTIDDPNVAAFGHAYGFIARRLLQDGAVPIIPVLLNTYYPPNVIRPARCYDIGRRIRTAIESIEDDRRVAVIASGGLSHFVTDADLDQRVIQLLRDRDEAGIGAIPMPALRAGSSEILCWIMAGGACEHLSMEWSDYQPVYRTDAGTGIGLGFAIWK